MTSEPRYVTRSDLYGTQPLYALRHPWPADMFAQGGRKTDFRDATPDEITDPTVGTYSTGGTPQVAEHRRIFMEIFPTDPSTFMRAEAATFSEAEDILWAQWQQITGCPGHQFEARGYRNGAGFCRHCGLFQSDVIDLTSLGSVCVACGEPTNWAHLTRLDDHGFPVRGTRTDITYDVVCQTHNPPSFSTISAGIEGDPDITGETLTDDDAAIVRLFMPPGTAWDDLDFDTAWAVAALFRGAKIHALLDEGQEARRTVAGERDPVLSAEF